MRGEGDERGVSGEGETGEDERGKRGKGGGER